MSTGQLDSLLLQTLSSAGSGSMVAREAEIQASIDLMGAIAAAASAKDITQTGGTKHDPAPTVFEVTRGEYLLIVSCAMSNTSPLATHEVQLFKNDPLKHKPAKLTVGMLHGTPSGRADEADFARDLFLELKRKVDSPEKAKNVNIAQCARYEKLTSAIAGNEHGYVSRGKQQRDWAQFSFEIVNGA